MPPELITYAFFPRFLGSKTQYPAGTLDVISPSSYSRFVLQAVPQLFELDISLSPSGYIAILILRVAIPCGYYPTGKKGRAPRCFEKARSLTKRECSEQTEVEEVLNRIRKMGPNYIQQPPRLVCRNYRCGCKRETRNSGDCSECGHKLISCAECVYETTKKRERNAKVR